MRSAATFNRVRPQTCFTIWFVVLKLAVACRAGLSLALTRPGSFINKECFALIKFKRIKFKRYQRLKHCEKRATKFYFSLLMCGEDPTEHYFLCERNLPENVTANKEKCSFLKAGMQSETVQN